MSKTAWFVLILNLIMYLALAGDLATTYVGLTLGAVETNPIQVQYGWIIILTITLIWRGLITTLSFVVLIRFNHIGQRSDEAKGAYIILLWTFALLSLWTSIPNFQAVYGNNQVINILSTVKA